MAAEAGMIIVEEQLLLGQNELNKLAKERKRSREGGGEDSNEDELRDEKRYRYSDQLARIRTKNKKTKDRLYETRHAMITGRSLNGRI